MGRRATIKIALALAGALLLPCLAGGWRPAPSGAANPAATGSPATAPDAARQTALLFLELFNDGDAPARDVQLSAALPASNAFQDIHRLEIHPPPDRQRRDAAGQTQAFWRIGHIAPGQAGSVLVLVQATLEPVANDWTGDLAAFERLTAQRRRDYLADDPTWLQLPDVARVMRLWVPRPSKDPTARARQVFDAIRNNCQYVLDNKRDSAAAVLREKKGSCTELSFAFIALCRVHGIPARMVTAWVNRGGDRPALDTINHRWAEYWDDRYGWVPVDLAQAANQTRLFGLSYRPERFFGQVPGAFLLVRDDGQGPPGRGHWSGYSVSSRGGSLIAERSSGWQPTADARAELKLFAEATQQMGQARPQGNDAELAGWAGSDRPLARYLLIPLLSSPSPGLRRQAAERLAESPDPTAAGALLLRAGRSRERADRRLLLDQVRRMLKRDDPQFRAAVLEEIGRSRLKDARPLAEAAARDEAHWRVRWSARQAVESIDRAAGKPTTRPAEELDLEQ